MAYVFQVFRKYTSMRTMLNMAVLIFAQKQSC